MQETLTTLLAEALAHAEPGTYYGYNDTDNTPCGKDPCRGYFVDPGALARLVLATLEANGLAIVRLERLED